MAFKTTKNLFLSFILILSLLLVPIVFASYTPDQVLTDDFAFTEYSNGELKEFVYLIAPTDYPLLTITLQGHGAYEPTFYLYDVSEERFAYQEKVAVNEKITYSFVPEAGDKNLPKEYYLIILSNGKEGSSFDFTYHLEAQNDAGFSMDAPKRFSDAQTISVGEYTANLGGGDEKDYYAFDIKQEETITITLVSTDKERLGFELIESTYVTTISERGTIEGLKRTFTSTSDQTIWLGIEGNTPYTFSIQSNKAPEEPSVQTLPPTPPTPPSPQELVEEQEQEQESKSLSTNTLIIILLIIVGLGLGILQFFRAKKIIKEKETRTSKKKK